MPHEVYNMLLDRCFDACVSTFNHKSLLNSEKTCLEQCATNFKAAPNLFQQNHQFAGFSEQTAGDIMPLPGMGGYKKFGNTQSFNTGTSKLGGGML